MTGELQKPILRWKVGRPEEFVATVGGMFLTGLTLNPEGSMLRCSGGRSK